MELTLSFHKKTYGPAAFIYLSLPASSTRYGWAFQTALISLKNGQLFIYISLNQLCRYMFLIVG